MSWSPFIQNTSSPQEKGRRNCERAYIAKNLAQCVEIDKAELFLILWVYFKRVSDAPEKLLGV